MDDDERCWTIKDGRADGRPAFKPECHLPGRLQPVRPSVRSSAAAAVGAAAAAAAAAAAVRPTIRSRSRGRSRSRRNRSRRRPSAGRPLQIHERLDTVALGFVVVSFSVFIFVASSNRKFYVAMKLFIFPESVSEGFSFSGLIYRGKVAPSLSVRSGGITFAYSHFGGERCAPRGANPYATDRFRAAAEPTAKIYGITGLYYGGINWRFGGSCWIARSSREKSLIWQEGNQSSRRITRM